MFEKLRTLLMISIFAISGTANADLAIIAHPDYQGGDLSEELVRELFLNERKAFPSGHKVAIANHAVGSTDRKYFF